MCIASTDGFTTSLPDSKSLHEELKGIVFDKDFEIMWYEDDEHWSMYTIGQVIRTITQLGRGEGSDNFTLFFRRLARITLNKETIEQAKRNLKRLLPTSRNHSTSTPDTTASSNGLLDIRRSDIVTNAALMTSNHVDRIILQLSTAGLIRCRERNCSFTA